MFIIPNKPNDELNIPLTMKVTGTIVTTKNKVYNISDKTLVQNSFSITRQSLQNNEIAFGGAIVSELDFSLKTKASRYVFYDGIVTVNCVVYPDTEYEYVVPLGVFNISEAERNNDYIKFVAYDNLIKLDEEFTLSVEGSPYALMRTFVEDCGCQLSSSQGEDFYDTLPNGNIHIMINQESGCKTYRGAVSIIAQMCGCFIQADRNGDIILCKFGTEPCRSVMKSDRFTSKIADYECKYRAVTVKGKAGKTKAVSETVKSGMVMKIDDAPGWDYGIKEVRQEMTNELLTAVEVIKYTPVELTMLSDPTLDCGDMILVESTTDDTEEAQYVTSIITEYTWSYRNKMSVTSTGANPHSQSNKSSESQDVRGLQSDVDAAKIIYYPFTNIEKVVLNSETYTTVATVRFTSMSDTSIIFQCTFQLNCSIPNIVETNSTEITYATLDSSGNLITATKTIDTTDTHTGKAWVKIKYYFDNAELLPHEYTHNLIDGTQVMTLYYPMANVKSNKLHKFEVRMSSDATESFIAKEDFIGAISGQGLAVTGDWDGEINIEEQFTKLNRINGTIAPINVGVSVVKNHSSVPSTINVNIPAITRKVSNIGPFRATLGFSNVTDITVRQQECSFNTNNYTRIANNNNLVLNQSYIYNSHTEMIDNGVLLSLPILTSDKNTITSMEVVSNV